MKNGNPVLCRMRELGGVDDAVGWVFGVSVVLHHNGEESPIGFEPAIVHYGLDIYPESNITDMLIHGEATTADLVFAAKCLGRYVECVRRNRERGWY